MSAKKKPADQTAPPQGELVPPTEVTELTLPERAKVALKTVELESQLTELAGRSKSIVAVTNADGREQAHGAMMALKVQRLEIERRGKSAREEAVAFSKAIIGEQHRLIAIIAPEEERLQELRDRWDEARRLEREAKAKAERDRVAAIQARINNEIQSVPLTLTAATAADIEAAIRSVVAVVVDAGFGEFREAAIVVQEQTLERLRQMLAARQQVEAEQKRLADERAQLERDRLAQEAAAKAEREQRIKEQQAAEAERKRQVDEEMAKLRAQAAENERIAKEQREQLERERQEQERAAAAERERQDAERERQQRALSQQQQEVERQRAELERQQAELTNTVALVAPATTPELQPVLTTEGESVPVEFAPSANEIVNLVASEYGVSFEQAMLWCVNAFDEVCCA